MTKKTRGPERLRSFRELRHWMERKNLPPSSPEPEVATPCNESAVDPEAERQLFRKAMDGVVPLRLSSRTRHTPTPAPLEPPRVQGSDSEAIERLHRLVDTGEGFNVADTPEYREGVGKNIPPTITRHLHKGQFSIQDHIDLHGLSAVQGEEALQAFFKDTVTAGKRAVLIIHGRGLSSPDKPVLKAMVHWWLEAGPWRHWVMAYSSARACDGGAGATVVLLRERPLTRRYRKRKHPGKTGRF